MKLHELLEQLREWLARPAGERSGKSAYGMCALSRRIHERVWESCPPRSWVAEEVVPALGEVGREIPNCGIADDYTQFLPVFARNVRLRVCNLKRYVKGDPPNFAPGAKLDDDLEIPSIESIMRSAPSIPGP